MVVLKSSNKNSHFQKKPVCRAIKFENTQEESEAVPTEVSVSDDTFLKKEFRKFNTLMKQKWCYDFETNTPLENGVWQWETNPRQTTPHLDSQVL